MSIVNEIDDVVYACVCAAAAAPLLRYSAQIDAGTIVLVVACAFYIWTVSYETDALPPSAVFWS